MVAVPGGLVIWILVRCFRKYAFKCIKFKKQDMME